MQGNLQDSTKGTKGEIFKMKIIKEHIASLLDMDMREDRRSLLEYRKPIKIEYGVSSKSTEGSAMITIGETQVIAGVKLEVGDPYPDTPDEGALVVGAELLPLSNPKFESGPPGIEAIEIARVVDRGIRESEAIDFKKLCIEKGEKVWVIYLDIYPINDAGNLYDASYLAAIAALKDAKFPEYDKKTNKVNYENKTSKGLALKYLPVSVTVIKIKNKFLVDPTTEEWESLDSRLTVATLEDSTICAMQKGGELPLTEENIFKMVEIATEKAKFLRGLL